MLKVAAPGIFSEVVLNEGTFMSSGEEQFIDPMNILLFLFLLCHRLVGFDFLLGAEENYFIKPQMRD